MTTRKTKAKPETEFPRLALHDLKPPRGSHRARIRKGRGPGSGIGKTAGRGGKGQTARAGKKIRPGFEGGQMPLIRRIPKRGFTNPFKQEAQVVNVRHLGFLAEGVEITPETLFGAGLVRRPDQPIKLLGMGEVAGRRFVVKGVAVSARAKSKIEQAGGTIE
ncbi:MAG: 50S ribosomal protein L15 [Gemmatimonadales bacterium]|nr:50S ribosomal protein L15 [Gemmatimonadales bacterium]